MLNQREKYILFGLLTFFLITLNKVSAQPSNLQLNQLSTDEGLSSSWIISMVQDQNGFMWIGTSTGLNRYDGHDFKVYKTKNTDPFSLADNFVIDLYLTESNKLYIGTNAGLSFYDPTFDRFVNLNRDSSSCFFNRSIQVRKITGDHNTNLYLATNIGLIIYNEKHNNYEVLAHDTINPDNKNNLIVEDVMFDSSGKLWVTSKQGLSFFDPETKIFHPINNGTLGEDFSAVSFFRIAEDNDGTIWVTSQNDGLFSLQNFGESKKLKHFVHNASDPNSISANRLLSILVDKQNNLWIGAENDGLYLFNRKNEKFHHYLNRMSDPHSMKTYSVERLYLDNSENLWIGTFANGVNILPTNSEGIVAFDKFKGGDLTIANNLVNYFTEDADGLIWIATDGGGINAFDKKTSLFTNLSTNNSEIPTDYITSLIEDKKEVIWMTSWGEGLVKYDHKKNKFAAFTTKNSNIQDDNIFSIAKGYDNDFWLGSFSKGLIHFEPEKNAFTAFNAENTKMNINYMNVVRAAPNEVLYLGTSRGLFSYTPKTGQFKNISLSADISESMSNLHVYDIFIENDTCLWVGTLMGLNCVNPQTGENTKYTIEDGLPGNIISGIIKDKTGKLWISTTNGLCRFDTSNKEFTLFSKEDGLQSNEYRPKSIYKDRSGALFFGGFNGFDIIYPEKIVKNNRVPQVQITGLELFNKPVLPNIPNSPLNTIICNTKEITLEYDHSVITFHFAVMDFTRPQKNKHAYILENFDNEWTYCDDRRSVTYTNLDPGKYIFRVKGANNDGLWNEQGTSLVLIITPPWWKTWTFRSIVVVFILLLIYSIYALRVSSLKRQKQLLKEKVESRTRELASINATKDKLFSIIAHDLRSPFNSILGFTEMLHNNFDTYDEKTIKSILADLKESSENSYTLLKNLLDWSGMQRGTIDFKPVQASVFEIATTCIQMLGAIAKKKEITIINNIVDQHLPILVDINMISLVFRNLLTNAIKFSKKGKDVVIDMTNDKDDYVVFSVVDNGVGIDSDKIKSLFKLTESKSTNGTHGEQGTGLGLLLCAEFIEKHKGKIWVESELKKGSTFYFTIPKVKP